MAVIAEEARICVRLTHAVRGEIQGVGGVLPFGDDSRHVVVHRHVRVGIQLPSDLGKIPATIVVRVPKRTEVEGDGRGDGEEVPHARVIPDEPVRGLGKEETVVSTTPGVVVLAGSGGEDQSHGPICVDVEDRDVGVFRSPVIDPDPVSTAEHRLGAPVEPDPGFQRIRLVVGGLYLGQPLHGARGNQCQAHQGNQRRKPDLPRPHETPP